MATENDAPKMDQKYWSAYINKKTNYSQVHKAVWKNDRIDQKRLTQKRVFKTKKQAEDWVESKS